MQNHCILILKWKESTIWDWLTGSGTAASINSLRKEQIPHITLSQLQHKLTKRIQINNWFRFFVVGLTDSQRSQMVLCESVCAGQERTSSLPDLPETQSTGRVCFPTCSQRDSNSSKLTGVQSVRFKLKDKPSFVCFMYSWAGPTRAAESEVFRWIRMNPFHSTVRENSLCWNHRLIPVHLHFSEWFTVHTTTLLSSERFCWFQAGTERTVTHSWGNNSLIPTLWPKVSQFCCFIVKAFKYLNNSGLSLGRMSFEDCVSCILDAFKEWKWQNDE